MTAAARRRAEQAAERDEAAHVKAECALREHPALGRWLRQTPVRAAAAGPGEDHRRGPAGREVPALHLRPGPVRRGRRAGLQEPAGSRTRVPRPEVHHRAAPGVPPARAPHPRPRAALLARAAADPGRRTPHRPDLAPASTASWAGCTRSPSPGRPARSSRPPNRPPRSRAFFGPADSPRHPGSPPSTPPEQHKRPHPASGRAWTHAHPAATRPFSAGQPTDSGVTSAHELRNPGDRWPTNTTSRSSSTNDSRARVVLSRSKLCHLRQRPNTDTAVPLPPRDPAGVPVLTLQQRLGVAAGHSVGGPDVAA